MIIEQILTKNLPFAVYRLPGDNLPYYLAGTCPAYEFSLGTLDEQKGFVVAPFDSYKSRKAFLIEPDLTAHLPHEIERLRRLLKPFPEKKPFFCHEKNPVTGKQEYIKQIRALQQRMQEEQVQKVVLSRVVESPLPGNFDFDTFFRLLQESYPRAFVYLFYLPGQGLWAGATPETFLSRRADRVETMALAGTQKQPAGPWGEKEKEEQAFVEKFVEEQIQTLGISEYDKGAVETVKAGKVAHLCTRFGLPAQSLKGKTGRLAALLHPTPAVCGLPKESAWHLIAETEHHRRHFYTGFLGPWQTQNHDHLFVNLRCAAFTREKITLYTGGGITAASTPEKEWQETKDKSSTLLAVVEKMRNFAP